mgnify:CR=1 FL=1
MNKTKNMKRLFIIIIGIIVINFSNAQTNLYPPTLVSPIDKAINQLPSVVLDWNPVAGAFLYKVQVSLDSTFKTTLNDSILLTSYKTKTLLFGKTYFWRIKTQGQNYKDTSNWTAFKRFVILDTVNIYYPNDNVVRQMPNTQVAWNAVSGIRLYDYEFDTTLNFNSTLLKKYSLNTTGRKDSARPFVYADQLNYGTKYYRKVRGRHSKDTSSWSKIRSFTTLDSFKIYTPLNNEFK